MLIVNIMHIIKTISMISNAKIKEEKKGKKNNLNLKLQLEEGEKHESHFPRTIHTRFHYGDQQSI